MSFSLNDFLSPESLKDSHKPERKIAMIAADKLHPAAGNFYSKEDERIRKMAASIMMLSTPGKIGIQQNLVVRPIPDTDEYTILAGETRWSAVMCLLEDGELDTDQIPCEIERADDPIRDELILILTNSTQRVRSDAEKMHEVKRLRELLEEYKKNHKIDGTIQKAIGDLLGISKTKVGTLENIDRNLSPELTAEYEKGNINTSVANKLAGMDEDAQRAGKELLDAKGAITAEDVKTLSETKDNDGQRPTYKKCITGWSRYGNCNCCGKNGAECCSQCQESCNARCGWSDNPYRHKSNEDQEPVYEMKYEMAEDQGTDEVEETVNVSFDIKNEAENAAVQNKDIVERRNTSGMSDDIRQRVAGLDGRVKEYLTESESKETAIDLAGDVLCNLLRVDGCREFEEIAKVDFMEVTFRGKYELALKDFVFGFYEAVIDIAMSTVGVFVEEIMENEYGRNGN